MSEANKRQIGGTHYKTSYEHWDMVLDAGLGYLDGCATKYVARWRKKDGAKDLEKALHYVEKLIETHALGDVPKHQARGCAEKFAEINGLDFTERACLIMICEKTQKSLVVAANMIRLLLSEITPQQRTDPTGQDHPFGYQPEKDLS